MTENISNDWNKGHLPKQPSLILIKIRVERVFHQTISRGAQEMLQGCQLLNFQQCRTCYAAAYIAGKFETTFHNLIY
jgi:hypothetical protein